jgi:hypothetical protein
VSITFCGQCYISACQIQLKDNVQMYLSNDSKIFKVFALQIKETQWHPTHPAQQDQVWPQSYILNTLGKGLLHIVQNKYLSSSPHRPMDQLWTQGYNLNNLHKDSLENVSCHKNYEVIRSMQFHFNGQFYVL